eukprot:TRINITY_DN7463_c0_g2_i1.p1 TRINITY_DN7463_c0_g2~~TRINITY_DN7463_c0_g2_i1.p1  ORF type:complete len:357 (+),score=78.42 TRINITY_DN7463_c0_g2_i1:107-1177(+)
MSLSGEIWLGVPLPKYEVTVGEEDAYFSKIGGEAKWLHGDADVMCGVEGCGRKMQLVSQVHAPLKVFDRILYVFGCGRSTCQASNDGWKVLRAQEYNADYDTDVKKETTKEVKESAFEVDDDWGGGGGFGDDGDDDPFGAAGNPFGCGGDSPFAEESVVVPPKNESSAAAKEVIQNRVWEPQHPTETDVAPFPMVPVDVIPEPSEAGDSSELRELRKKYGHLTTYDSMGPGEGTGGGADEEYEKQGTNNQRAFMKFSKRVARYPSQVIRWCFGGKPLEIDAAPVDKVLPCSNCGSKKVPEAQVLSTSISYLSKEEDVKKESIISFGTITVYTCEALCFAGDKYVEESVRVSREPDF